ncbi:MAG: ABC transporter ATP-binding protein [Fulvivirga sp.]|uniref:ABC transporter ATP-binding protein n=2 Tax=Fulvivirga sp. TaxID=1931237 RepID=UPI0032EB37A4
MSLIRKILSLFDSENKNRIFILFWMMLLSAVLEVLGIGIVPIVIKYILQPEELKNFPWLYDFLDELNLLTTKHLFLVGSVMIILVFLMKNAYRFYVDFKQLKLIKHIQTKLASDLFSKYLFSPYQLYLNRNTSTLIRNINNEVSYIAAKVLIPSFLILLNIIILIAIFISMLVVEFYMTTIVVSFLVIAMGGFNLLLRRKLRRYGKTMQQERRLQLQYLYQGLQGLKAIKVANREHFFYQLFKNSTLRLANTQLRVNMLSKLPSGYLEIVAVVMILFLTGGLLFLAYQGTELTYLLSFFGLALVRMRQNFSAIMVNLNLVRSNEVSIDPVVKDMKIQKDREQDDTSLDQSLNFEHKISFQNVSFNYQSSESKVINKINFEIEKGEIIGIAGATGGGKTTILDLILGLHQPTEGYIKVDNVDLQSMLSLWQKSVGYVPQNIYLLDDTIIANIAFGIKPNNVDLDRVKEVVKAAQLFDFVNSLDKGLKSKVGENGVKISGGQRQRIGIARALYNNPQILIFDEATSALDNKTERKFVEILHGLDDDLTIIMVAHRLSTLEKCDRILFLENGMISSQGSYQELLKNNKLFQEMSGVT